MDLMNMNNPVSIAEPQNTEKASDEILFEYEKTASGAYLVLNLPCISSLIEYQYNMIKNNTLPFLLPMDIRRLDDQIRVYYNITGLMTLSTYLGKNRLGKAPFVDMLKCIIWVLIEGRRYLLDDTNFVLKEDFIYINPETQEVLMVYVPIANQRDTPKVLRALISNIIVHTAKVDYSMNDNTLQRILGFMKSDSFNLDSFFKHLEKLQTNKTKLEAEICQDMTKPQEFLHVSRPEVHQSAGVTRMGYGKMVLVQLFFILLLISGYLLLFLGQPFDIVSLIGLIVVIGALDVTISMRFLKEKSVEVQENKAMAIDKTVVIKRTAGVNSKEITATLVRVDGEKEERVIISKERFIVGRLKGQANFVSNNNAIGKLHAEIIRKGERFYIKDLNSKNGTFINGVRIKGIKEAPIVNGDKLQFADNEYLFTIP